MNVKGAEEVVTNLNGYETSPGHHLVVEKYVSTSSHCLCRWCIFLTKQCSSLQRMRSPSPPPPHPPSGSSLSDLTGVEHIKLFVKNMSTDHSLAHLKTVFSRYGKVLKMLPDPKRKNITYIVSFFGNLQRCVVEYFRQLCVHGEGESTYWCGALLILWCLCCVCYSLWTQRAGLKPSTTFTGRPFLKMENLLSLNQAMM